MAIRRLSPAAKVGIIIGSLILTVIVLAASGGRFAGSERLLEPNALLGGWTADAAALERHIAAFPDTVQRHWRARAQEWLHSTVHIDDEVFQILGAGAERRRTYRVASRTPRNVVVEFADPVEQLSISVEGAAMTWTTPDLSMSFWERSDPSATVPAP